MEAIEEPSVIARNTLSDEELYARIGEPFYQRNPDLRFERERDKKLIIMNAAESLAVRVLYSFRQRNLRLSCLLAV
jgi:hypothetical protein